MIKPKNKVGKKTVDGKQYKALMDAEVADDNELLIKLYPFKDTDYKFGGEEVKVMGYPMGKANDKISNKGEVKYLLNDIVKYVDYSKMIRVVDLGEVQAYCNNNSTVSVNNIICSW